MKVNVKELYGIMLGVFSTFYMIRVRGIPVFFYIAIVGILLFPKLSFKIDKAFALYIISLVLSFVVNSYRPYQYRMAIMMAMNIIILIIYLQLCASNERLLLSLIKGIKISCLIQVGWCIVQFVFFHMFDLDINQIIFSDILNMIEKASRYNNGKIVLTGLCWHPSNMVPVLIFTLVLFDRWYMWLICLFVAVGMNSSTVIMAISALAIVKICLKLRKYKRLISRKRILTICIGCICFCVAANLYGDKVVDEVLRLIGRISGSTSSLSTSAHMSYYTLLPEVWKNSELFQILFGYGPDCSGLAITNINGQYSSLGAWVVESDYMNLVYGLGMFGAISYITWIFRIVVKSRKRSFFSLLIIPLLIGGITYNVQYYWVVFALIVFSLADKKMVHD